LIIPWETWRVTENYCKEVKVKMKMQIIGRLPRTEAKTYYTFVLQEFANFFDSNKGVECIQYGKQDIRGADSITIVYEDSCSSGFKYFGSMKELLEYCAGFVDAKTDKIKQYTR